MPAKKILTVFSSLLFLSVTANATIIVTMYSTKPGHKKLGEITFENKSLGLEIRPKLSDLPPGIHGFHIHANPSCDHEGMAAGGHHDPDKTEKHLGPFYATGHLGDLPTLSVDKKGIANHSIFAPRLTEDDLYGHSVVIHEGGDNYSDSPQPLGGGGARIACGVIDKKPG